MQVFCGKTMVEKLNQANKMALGMLSTMAPLMELYLRYLENALNYPSIMVTFMDYHQRPSIGPSEASHLSATRWTRGGLQGRPLDDLWSLASSELTSCLSCSLLGLLIFCFTDSGLQQPSWYCNIAYPRGTGSAFSLVPLGGYRRHAYCVPSCHWATTGPLEVRWM